MNLLLDTIIRTLIGFAMLLILIRIIGKKQLGQMNIFTYITGIAIGNMAGDMIIHKDVRIIDGITGMVLWGILAIGIEYIALKNSKARIFLDGEPTIIVKKGQIIEKELKKHRMNIDDFTMLLRTNSVFSVQDIEYAILEPNGELSVLKKPEKEFVTRQDMNVPIEINNNIPCEIIVDGKIVPENLREFGKDQTWLLAELQKQGISQVQNVLYGQLQSDGSLYIQKREGKANN